MSRKNMSILSTVVSGVSVLWILGMQFFTGGRNPIDPVMFLLMLAIGGSAEIIAYSAFRNKILKILPLAAAIGWAIWGIYLYLNAEAWANVTVLNLIGESWPPAIGATASLVLLKIFYARDDISKKKRG